MGTGVRSEHRQQVVGQGDDGPEVDVNHPAELLQSQLVEAPAHHHPGVVDQQRRLRVGPGQLPAGPRSGVLVGEVRHDGVDLDGWVARADRCCHAGEPVGVAVEQHQVTAACRQAVRQGFADAAGCTRDDGRATAENMALHETWPFTKHGPS